MTLIYDTTTDYDSTTVYSGTNLDPYDYGTGSYDGTGLYDSGVTYSGYLFTPPNVKFVPPFLPDSTGAQRDLWRHFENRERGVNVWVMSDGSVRQSDPTPENSNTSMVGIFPWDPFNPSAPYVRSIYIDAGANPQSPTEHDTVHNPYVVAYFAGASTYPVSNAQYELLLNYTAYGTGYSDRLTPESV
jgi:hypothetical protein